MYLKEGLRHWLTTSAIEVNRLDQEASYVIVDQDKCSLEHGSSLEHGGILIETWQILRDILEHIKQTVKRIEDSC